MIFRTELVNMDHHIIYEGQDPNAAIDKAMKSGFEAMVTNVTAGISCFYSPITGWRGSWKARWPATNSSDNCRRASDDTC